MTGVTYFSALQLAFAALALVLIARSLRLLLFEAPLDTGAFLAALAPALAARELELARVLARECLPAWPARLALHGLGEIGAGRDPRAGLEETRAELERGFGYDAGRAAIAVLGRIASPLAFIGIIVEAGRALGGGEGIVALQRGLPETLALQRSLLAFALGVATTIVCAAAVGIARRQAQALQRDLERVTRAILRTEPGSAEM